MQTVAELAGVVTADGEITVSTSDELRGSIKASGGGNGASGAYIAIVVVNQTAKANVVAGTTVTAAGLSVKGIQTSIMDTTAISGSGEAEEGEETAAEETSVAEEEPTSNAQTMSLEDLLEDIRNM